jgi:hypothetical protein
VKCQRRGFRRVLTAALATAAAVWTLAAPAHASTPTPATLYQLPSTASCTKSVSNCVLYPKAAALPDGRLVAAFEESTVQSSGSADGQTIPIYKSDDNGTTWQYLTGVKAPAYASSNSAYAQYVSNWTNPYLYVLPQAVGNLASGTLMMASVVSGDDYNYLDNKATNSSYQPTHDGDRSNTAIALYASTDNGADWTFENIIATGTWSNGLSYPATEDTHHENDPVWEPYLMVYDNELVAYYSDENDYTGYNTTTGVPTLDPNNNTTPDADTQILAHRTWDGVSSDAWSGPVVDVSGTTITNSSGYSEIGGGRPGMTNVVETSDGEWMMTFEYWGGGDNVRYKISSNPLDFYAVGGTAGTGISSLPVTSGSSALAQGGSPVLLRLPNGRILFNAAGSGAVWTNAERQQHRFVDRAADDHVLRLQPQPHLCPGHRPSRDHRRDDHDLVRGHRLRKLRGRVLPAGQREQRQEPRRVRRNLLDGTDVVQWTTNTSTDQLWHVTSLGNGYDTLLDEDSGRALGIWQASTAGGADAVQWVQNASYDQQWQLIAVGSHYELLNRNSGLALTVSGSSTSDGAQAVQQAYTGATSQLWSLTEVSS